MEAIKQILIDEIATLNREERRDQKAGQPSISVVKISATHRP
jgi:hypothetical protein